MIDDLILSHILNDEDYGRKVLPFLKEEYFQDRGDRILFSIIHSYVGKYNNFPTKEALLIDLNNEKKVTEDDFKQCKEKISVLQYDEKTDKQWLLDQTEKFCQEKAIYNGIMKSIQILDGKDKTHDKGSIPKVLQDALAVSFDTNIGHDFLEDWNERYIEYHRVENKIPFNIDLLNKVTKGGFSKKTLNVFLGGTNVGKTLVMAHMAAHNLLMGKNVLYITLEMSEERIAERIDANLLDITLDDLMLLPKDVYEKKINKVRSQVTTGKLIIKEYPTASAGANHFRFLLNELRLKKNFVPDVIYVDYINLCVSSRVKFGGSVNSYGYIKAIAEELRGLAGEYDVALITATQLNREGFSNSDADLTHTAESFALPQTADFMAVIISNEQLESLNQYMIKQLKNRYNRKNIFKKFIIGVDVTKMRLYDIEQSKQNLSQDVDDDIPVMDYNKSDKKFDRSKFKDWK